MFELLQRTTNVMVVPFDLDRVVSQITPDCGVVGVIRGDGYLAQIASIQFPVIFTVTAVRLFGSKPKTKGLLFRQLF